MKKRGSGITGKVIALLLFMLAAVFLVLVQNTGMIPGKYLAVGGIILTVLFLLIGFLLWDVRRKDRFTTGIILMLVVMVFLGLGGAYLYRITTMLNRISDIRTETTKVSVYVKAESALTSLNDVAAAPVGILKSMDRKNTDQALAQMNQELGNALAVQEYDGITQLIDGLYQEEVHAVVLNQAYLSVLEGIEKYLDLESRIREVTVNHVETVMEEKEETGSADTLKDDVLCVYISGIDTRGEMTANSRSDVNIIATVNTRTQQVLLLSTPRDYFVPLSISDGVPDKLTHAGIYGVDVSMDTLSMLYDIDIDYYFRLNFGGFVKIIDALGGITVVSDYAFDVQGAHFEKGKNFVNGEQALAFARERYSFAEGDRQRGKNQMAVIKGVAEKVLSADLLKNYASVMKGIEGCFETNIPYKVLTRLVKQQLSQDSDWNIVSYSVDGTGDTQQPYSMSTAAYVMIPDDSTVDKAKELMQQVREGEILSQE